MIFLVLLSLFVQSLIASFSNQSLPKIVSDEETGKSDIILVVITCSTFTDCMNCSLSDRCIWSGGKCEEHLKVPWWAKTVYCNNKNTSCPKLNLYVLTDEGVNSLNFKFPSTEEFIQGGTYCQWTIVNPSNFFMRISIVRGSV